MVPSFSCDGTHIAFEGQREGQAFSQAYVVRADGIGEATLVYPQPDAQQVGPKFSPNCKQLCFASTAGVLGGCLARRNGKVRRLTTNPGLFPGFTPGGI